MRLTAVLAILLCGVLSAASALGKEAMVSKVSMHADEWPVMIRRADNPAVRLDIEIPAGGAAQRLENVDVDLKGTGRKMIESLDMLKGGENDLSGFEPPSGKRSGSIPASMKLGIPTVIDLTPGMNHVWINVHLGKYAMVGGSLTIKPVRVKISGKLYGIDQAKPVVQRVGYVVAQAGDKVAPTGRRCQFFRIPGLVKTRKGTLLACMDIRYDRLNDLPSDIDVGISRSTDGGETWSPVSVALDSRKAIPGIPGTGAGDASILVDQKTGRIWIAALWANGVIPLWGPHGTNDPAKKCGQLLICHSDDDGRTWSSPVNITNQVKLPEWGVNFQGPGIGISLKDGTLVFPCQFWFDEKGGRRAHASIIYSKDGGKTWKCGKASSSGTSESQVVQLSDGSLMLNSRNENRSGYRIVSVTRDLGETWESHPTSDNKNGKGLVEPRQACQASLLAIPGLLGEKNPLFFSNPQFHDKERHHMVLRVSLDEGKTWTKEDALLYDVRDGWGYSSMIPLDDKHMGVLYEGRGVLFFLRVPFAEILGNAKDSRLP